MTTSTPVAVLREAAAHIRADQFATDISHAVADLLDAEATWAAERADTYPDDSHCLRIARKYLGVEDAP